MKRYWSEKESGPDLESQVLSLLICLTRAHTFLDQNPSSQGIFPGREPEDSQELRGL